MSVHQPISYGLLQQVGPGEGAEGYGSYQADNVQIIRPYQQKAVNSTRIGYIRNVIKGPPTVYNPEASLPKDPVVELLKKILNKNHVVGNLGDGGFRRGNGGGDGGDGGDGGGDGGGNGGASEGRNLGNGGFGGASDVRNLTIDGGGYINDIMKRITEWTKGLADTVKRLAFEDITTVSSDWGSVISEYERILQEVENENENQNESTQTNNAEVENQNASTQADNSYINALFEQYEHDIENLAAQNNAVIQGRDRLIYQQRSALGAYARIVEGLGFPSAPQLIDLYRSGNRQDLNRAIDGIQRDINHLLQQKARKEYTYEVINSGTQTQTEPTLFDNIQEEPYGANRAIIAKLDPTGNTRYQFQPPPRPSRPGTSGAYAPGARPNPSRPGPSRPGPSGANAPGARPGVYPGVRKNRNQTNLRLNTGLRNSTPDADENRSPHILEKSFIRNRVKPRKK